MSVTSSLSTDDSHCGRLELRARVSAASLSEGRRPAFLVRRGASSVWRQCTKQRVCEVLTATPQKTTQHAVEGFARSRWNTPSRKGAENRHSPYLHTPAVAVLPPSATLAAAGDASKRTESDAARVLRRTPHARGRFRCDGRRRLWPGSEPRRGRELMTSTLLRLRRPSWINTRRTTRAASPNGG